MAGHALKKLRQAAPPQDRNDPALIPTAQPAWATGRDGGRHVAIGLYPRTQDELRKMARSFGEAALAELRWSAVTTWLMKDNPSSPALNRPMAAALDAVFIIQRDDRHRLGWPTHDGKTRPLTGLTADSISEARAVAADTLTDWLASGSPYSDPARIKATYHYLVSTPSFIAKYIGPDRASDSKDTN